jgi:hypothetical protein
MDVEGRRWKQETHMIHAQTFPYQVVGTEALASSSSAIASTRGRSQVRKGVLRGEEDVGRTELAATSLCGESATKEAEEWRIVSGKMRREGKETNEEVHGLEANKLGALEELPEDVQHDEDAAERENEVSLTNSRKKGKEADTMVM